MKPLVSVIIPVYNSDKYLEDCIESLINQTLNNIELIFINDGSIDNSKSIIEKYKEKDKRIVLKDKKNTGASDCRNIGLKIANGKYIGFVDSDDWVSQNMFEELYKEIEKNNSDMCIGGYSLFIENTVQKIESKLDKNLYKKNELINKIAMQMIESNSLNEDEKIPGFIWSNIYKKDVIQNNNISFYKELKIGEDTVFNLNFLKYSNSVSVCNNCGYFYRYNINSQTAAYNKDLKEIMYNFIEKVEKFINSNELIDFVERRVDILLINTANYLIINESNIYPNIKVKERLDNIKKICSDNKIQQAIDNINLKNVKFKKRIITSFIKNRLSITLFLYYSIKKLSINIKNREN
jgi:glycosyltransferase EpsH